MTRSFIQNRYADRNVDYIDLDVERFYTQGLECFRWGLPRRLVRQALRSVAAHHRKITDTSVDHHHLRAFATGLAGRGSEGGVARLAPVDYVWPEAPDPSWDCVIFVFPDGGCEMDYLHPVSFECWSNQNGVPELPPDPEGRLTRNWFGRMGFEIVVAMTEAAVAPAAPGRPASHLSVVK